LSPEYKTPHRTPVFPLVSLLVPVRLDVSWYQDAPSGPEVYMPFRERHAGGAGLG
jgi:hypothetical protein